MMCELAKVSQPTAAQAKPERYLPRGAFCDGEVHVKTIFVMIKCDLGKAYAVADEAVQGIEEVSEVYSTSGQYDLMVKCHLADEVDIGHFVTEQVQALPGIKDTFTIIAFKAFSPDTTAG
jgi:DNA-binding Lrp family transcriptional regulator